MTEISYSMIADEISEQLSEDNIVIWKSEMDGLGTSLSDIDAYCICQEEKVIESFVYDRTPVDVEYLNSEMLKDKIKKICRYSNQGVIYKGLDEDLKLFYRLQRGVKSVNCTFSGLEIPKIDEISKIAANYYYELFLGIYEDAYKMYYGKNKLDAFVLSLETLQMSIATYLARLGKPQFKKKWLFKYFNMVTNNSLYKDLITKLESDSYSDLMELTENLLANSKKLLEI